MHTPGNFGADRALRIVLTVNTSVKDREVHGGGTGTGDRRTDFEELRNELSASVIDWSAADRWWIGRLLRRKFGFGPVAAILTFLSHQHYDVIWCFTEIEGLLLSLLFKLFRIQKTLFFIAVEPTSSKSMFFLRRLRVWTHFTAILPTNAFQATKVIETGGVPADKVVILPYQVDCKYFQYADNWASKSPTRPLIVAAGLEARDYATLVEAVANLDVDLFVAAASLWSGDRARLPNIIPENVTVGKCSYGQLRDLYAQASLAVIPLRDSPYQHGITAVQEAMAMSLPVIVTRTEGQSDVVVDRRRSLRSDPSRNTDGGFARLFRPDSEELRQCNGL